MLYLSYFSAYNLFYQQTNNVKRKLTTFCFCLPKDRKRMKWINGNRAKTAAEIEFLLYKGRWFSSCLIYFTDLQSLGFLWMFLTPFLPDLRKNCHWTYCCSDTRQKKIRKNRKVLKVEKQVLKWETIITKKTPETSSTWEKVTLIVINDNYFNEKRKTRVNRLLRPWTKMTEKWL